MDVAVTPDLGGGHGYPLVVTESDATTTVTSASSLVNACQNASSGDVIFVPGDVTIDMSGHSNIGFGANNVTLASDRGHEGSDGALLYDTTTTTDHPNALFKAYADDIRVSGLRIRGPEPDQVGYNSSTETSAIWYIGNNCKVDNCEIYHWHLAAIKLAASSYTNNTYHIHHNHIHHNRMEALGYGIEQYDSHALYEFNFFNAHRHDISAYGSDTCSYEARYNVSGPISHGHSFDMHNWDQNDGDKSVAGKFVNIHHNTWMFYEEIGKFLDPNDGDGEVEYESAITIRGVPAEQSYVNNNWFRHTSLEAPGWEGGPVYQHRVDDWTNIDVSRNSLGESAPSTPYQGAPRPHDVDHLVTKVFSD